MKPFRIVASAVALALIVNAPAQAQQAEPAPLSQLVAEVDIPYETFTLPNGLTTIVHTDRKSPIVGVTIYYRVGSKNEPRGRTGFAHLFEHLMFGGSENVENFDVPLEAAGSTSTNGSTWYDRTNYIETVPTGALDLALFMESDRMGHLLGAVTQDKLDKQRGVVQNEKRQGDNQPYGLVDYKIGDALFPVGHPYRHSTIGSMADLDAASITDVRTWFTDHYAPNNVVLVLAGDIDAAAARPMVERWFGDIPRGPEVQPVTAPPVTLAAPLRETTADQVPVTRVIRSWSGPALTDPDAVPLQVGLYVLGGLNSSRLDNTLVRGEQLAVSVTAMAQQFEQLSFLQAQMDVKPGVDPAAAEKRFDEVIAEFVARGPTEDELQRAATQVVSSQIGALELVGGFSGKGATLAEGLLYAGDPAHYKKELAQLATLTPAQVQAALQRWLSRPAYTLTVVPGERTEEGTQMGGWGDEGTVPAPAADRPTPLDEFSTRSSEVRTAPPVAPVGTLTFPQVEHATLSNGIPVTLARRTAVPKVSVALAFDAGDAADGGAHAGTQSLMMELLEEGTKTRSAVEIAIAQERLGAEIAASTRTDTNTVSMSALTANLAPSLALMADLVRNPAFAPSEVARVKDQRLAQIAQEQADPAGLAWRALDPLVYGDSHPYGSVGASGKASVIEALTPEALAQVHDTWLRPDTARVTVVGDVTMAELLPALEAAFGDWRAPATPKPVKNLAAAIPPAKRRLVVIDRPNSPQSVLLLGGVLPISGKLPEQVALANEVIGNGFLSRLNLNLREEKGWSYGIRSSLPTIAGPREFAVYTQVQSDRTADSIRLILDDMAAFATDKGVSETELQRVTDGKIRGLPNSFQTNSQVLSALLDNQLLGRPDTYQASLPDIYRAIDAAQIDSSARQYLSPDDLVIVVVGDRKQIDDQLQGLGMAVEYLNPDDL